MGIKDRSKAIWSPDKYRRALNFASEAHGDQKVPGQRYSYINHLACVAMEVIACLDRNGAFSDPDLAVQCALLHDCIEDAGVEAAELSSRFGHEVAAGVQALTKKPKAEMPSKRNRMLDSLSRIREQPSEVWIVKMADRITNLQPPPAHWNDEKILAYKAEANLILESLGAADAYLAGRLRDAIQSYKP